MPKPKYSKNRSLELSSESQLELRNLTNQALSHPATGQAGANMVDKLLSTATALPASSIKKYVESLRRKNPEATPAELVNILSAHYRNILASTGGAVGAAAAIPAVGTATAVALTGADLAAFFATSSIYALAVAEVHGVRTDDPERRKALVLASVLGNSGADTVSALGAVPVARWGRSLMTTMPNSTITQVNRVLKSRFLKRSLAKHSGLALGRIIPFGVGAAIGFAGGRTLAGTVINQASKAFGPAPTTFADYDLESEVVSSETLQVEDPDSTPQIEK